MKGKNLSNSRFNRNIAMLVAASLIIIAIVVMAYGVLKARQNNFNNKIVATVNEEPITVREFEFRMERGRGYVIQYFNRIYGVERDSPKFWNTSYSGVIPLEYAKEKYLNESIRIKVQQILARERGLVNDISYSAFLEKLDEENRIRQEALKKGQVVHGLLQYGEEDHFFRLFKPMVGLLMQQLIEEKIIIVTEEEIRQYYEFNKEKEFSRQDYLNIQRIYIEFRYGDENGKDVAYKEIQHIKERLDTGENFDSLINAIKNNDHTELRYEDLIIDDNVEIIDIEDLLYVKSTAEQLPVYHVSGIIEEMESFNIIRCIERRGGGFIPFDDTVKNYIEMKIIEEKYNRYIDDQIDKVNIVIDEDILKKVTIDKKYR